MNTLPSATIPDTEVRILQASFAPQEYQISVALPFHYHERAEKIYPVIYVLDANLFFGMAVEMVRAMNVRVPCGCARVSSGAEGGVWLIWWTIRESYLVNEPSQL